MPRMIEGGRRTLDYSEAGNDVSRDESPVQDDKKLLEALRHSKLYQDYERTFTEATGLPLALRPVEFFGLPFRGKKNENAFCAFLADKKSFCALCLQTQARVTESRGDNPHSIQCPYGLTETVVPIVLGERVLGFLCTGQVFTSPAKVAKSPRQPVFAKTSGVSKEALHLWKQTRFVEAQRYQATVQLLTFFAKQLSMLTNQLLIEQKYSEPTPIARARRFIAENRRGQLTLATVARAAGVSMFHFSTLFRQTTGIKFTQYVARSRIEDARELLCNPRLRMCEVAYEAGFQSLTAFNRAFQRVLGQSPTKYRNALTTTRTRLATASRASWSAPPSNES